MSEPASHLHVWLPRHRGRRVFGEMRNHLLSKRLAEFKSNLAPLVFGKLVRVSPVLLSSVQIPPGRGGGDGHRADLCWFAGLLGQIAQCHLWPLQSSDTRKINIVIDQPASPSSPPLCLPARKQLSDCGVALTACQMAFCRAS